MTAGMAVFDTMRHVRPDVSTVCVGLAASMGAFLLTAGQQVRMLSITVCAVVLSGQRISSSFNIRCRTRRRAHALRIR